MVDEDRASLRRRVPAATWGRISISDLVSEERPQLTGARGEPVRMHGYQHRADPGDVEGPRADGPPRRDASRRTRRARAPGGCRASEIPAAAQVLAAADAFQSMTEERRSRAALDREHAAGRSCRSAAQWGRRLRRSRGSGRSCRPTRPPATPTTPRCAPHRPGDRGTTAGLRRACSNREPARRAARHLRDGPPSATVQNTYAKISVTSRSAAALFAIEHDLLPAVD